MPFTLFAHQAPVLPLKMRYPDRWDGLGLAVGSIMPDLWYVTTGWGFGPVGIPMWVDAHPLGVQPQYVIIPGMALTWLLRRVVMPVVPSALPGFGFLRLRDYRLLSLSRYRWWVTAYSVAVGSLTHLFFDAFTHRNGFVVDNVASLQEPILTVGATSLTVYRLLQVVGHVIGSAVAVHLLVVLARDRRMWAWHGSSGRPPDQEVLAPGVLLVRSILVIGLGLGTAYGVHRFDRGFGTAFIGFLLIAIASAVTAGAFGRRFFGPVLASATVAVGDAPSARSPTPVDPLVE